MKHFLARETGDGLAEMSYSGTYLLQSGGLGTWNVTDQDLDDTVDWFSISQSLLNRDDFG